MHNSTNVLFTRKLTLAGLFLFAAGYPISHVPAQFGIATVVISAPGDNHLRRNGVMKSGSTRALEYPEVGTASLLEIASLIEGARIVVTPDTAIVHFASAIETPVVSLFSPILHDREWLPHRAEHAVVLAYDGKPVALIASKRITDAVDQLWSLTDKQQPRDNP